MEDHFSFDLNFDFLDVTTSNVKENAINSSSYQQQTASSQVYDVEKLANKIASVNDLVLQLKTEKEEHAKLQKQMKDLNDSAMSIRSMYEQEKAEKAKYALSSQEFKEKCELAESQLANKTLHFDQLSSKIEESTEKGPIPYNELALRYFRLASYLEEDKQLNQKEKLKLQQIQEYVETKKLTTLPAFKKKKTTNSPNKPEQKDQETQSCPETVSQSTNTDLEAIPKQFVSQGTQHEWYTTTQGTNTENQSPKKQMTTQGTQYISSTTTRSTSTLGIVKTHSIGTNFPDESTKLVEDIFNEMIYDITPLSPLAEEVVPPARKAEMKTVDTMTELKNVQKAIDYVAAINIKASDSRPPSRNMYERVKNEIPFMGIPSMNSFVEPGANSSSSVPSNITELWNLLGQTFFGLLQNVNTFSSSMNLDRMRNTNIDSSDGQSRTPGVGSNFEKDYFKEPCRSSNSPRGFVATTRSTATSPIAELEASTSYEERFDGEACANTTISGPEVSNPTINGSPNNMNLSQPVEIQKIVLNKVFPDVPQQTPAPAEADKKQVNLQTKKKDGTRKPKKRRKSSREDKERERGQQAIAKSSSLETSRMQEEKKSIPVHTAATDLTNSHLAEKNSDNGSLSEDQSVMLEIPEDLLPESILNMSPYSSLEEELFGTSDDEDEESRSEVFASVPETISNKQRQTIQQQDIEVNSQPYVFCKPFMPKKRRQDSMDTRLFQMEELKAAQQFPVNNGSSEHKISPQKTAHSKRKRSAVKPLHKFSKVRVCSKSSSDISFHDISPLSPQHQRNDNGSPLSYMLTEESPKISEDLPATITQHIELSSDIPSCSLRQTNSGLENVTGSSKKPDHNSSTGTILDEARNEMQPDLNVMFKEDSPLNLVKRTASEAECRSAECIETQQTTKRGVSPRCEVLSVINVSSNKPLLLGNYPSSVETMGAREIDRKKAILKNSRMAARSENLTHLPAPSNKEAMISPQNSSSAKESIEKNSLVPSSLREIDYLKDKSNSPCVTETSEIERQETAPSNEPTAELVCSSEPTESRLVTPCSTMSEPQSPPASIYHSPICNDTIENLLLDDNREKFQEIFHRICHEFATPERPVSAIPPFEISETKVLFSEENSTSETTPHAKEKTKRKKGTSPVTAVKRSERLKAKNLIQEAIKYSSLKIPAVELGKYTKRKTEQKKVCEESTEDKALSPPRQSDGPQSADTERRMGFFEDCLQKEESFVKIDPVSEDGSQVVQPTNKTTNISNSDSEEDTSGELVIDLPDDLSPTQEQSQVNSMPEEDKHDAKPTEILSTEPLPIPYFDESPSSPAPCDREPEPDHRPLMGHERNMIKPKTKSLLSQLIANYNSDYFKKAHPRKDPDKNISKQLLATLTCFVNVPCDAEATLRAAEAILAVTTCEQLIAHGLISIVKTAPRPEAESAQPVPDLHTSQTLEKIISLLEPLYFRLPNLRAAILAIIEKSLFTFTKEFSTLEMTLNLTQLYLAVIADNNSPSNPARLFICKSLYFYTRKSVPMTYEALCVYPSVLPHRDDLTYDRSDALISTIQCLLNNTYYELDKCDLKSKQMLSKLRNFYNYESFKPSREEVIENLVAKIRAGRFKNVSFSFALIGKRIGQKQCEKILLGERLLPLANEYYQSIDATAENDQRIACVLECISYLIKPFPLETDVTSYVNLFSRFLNATDRQIVQEAAISATLRTARFGFVQCFSAVYNFQPKYELSTELKVMLRSFVYKKGQDYLRKLENQMQVLTQ